MQENPDKQGLSLWFVALAAVFVICLITANIIAVKLLPAAVIFFPVSDIVGHMITEVYGSRQARRVIWLGFGCNVLAVAAIWGAGALPAADFWDGQDAYHVVTLHAQTQAVTVSHLKRAEGLDTYDRKISFNPLTL